MGACGEVWPLLLYNNHFQVVGLPSVTLFHSVSKTPERPFDIAAIGLSGACMAHCLVLPLVAMFVPVLAGLTHAHWVHWVFVGLAVPISVLALSKVHGGVSNRIGLWTGAGFGIALLVMGALGFPSHDWETALTVLGGLVLAGVHSLNFYQNREKARQAA
jgi:hypothetical protein